MRRKVSQGETLDQRVFRAEAEAHSGELTLKEYIECRDFVEARLRHWIQLLGLRWWEVVTHYYNTEKSADGEDSSVMARCWTEWEYRKIITSWYIPTINRSIGRDQVKLDKLIIHEFMHALVNPMRYWWPKDLTQREVDQCMKMEEMTVTNLTTAFWFAYEAALNGGEFPSDNRTLAQKNRDRVKKGKPIE